MKRNEITRLFTTISQIRTKGFTATENLQFVGNYRKLKEVVNEINETLLKLLDQLGIEHQSGIVDTKKIGKEAFAAYKDAETKYLEEDIEFVLPYKFCEEKILALAESNDLSTLQLELILTNLV